eukprot:augustus_masked-scaffold_49-processed-gene-1.23-mRNA-1 protein AED:0.24 eAED:0.24 QI:0/0/0/1/1/1/2/0/652
MKKKAHGTTEKPVQENLRWNVDRKEADKICSFNRHYAEKRGTFLSTAWIDEVQDQGPIEYYDSVSGKLLYTAPVGRSFEEFLAESRKHGWPSFRDQEVNWENHRVLPGGEAVSVDGTHLGHNLPDAKGNRYCINLCCIAGYPREQGESTEVKAEIEEKIFDMKKDGSGCTGLFWRSDPRAKRGWRVKSSVPDWPRDGAQLKGLGHEFAQRSLRSGNLNLYHKIPRKIKSLAKIKIRSISACYSHSFALSIDGDLFSWGNGEQGKLGFGADINIPEPNQVTVFCNESGEQLEETPLIAQARGGLHHSIILDMENNFYTCGSNSKGALGTATERLNTFFHRVPLQYALLDNSADAQVEKVKQVDAGREFSLALCESGKIFSWGANEFKQLGLLKEETFSMFDLTNSTDTFRYIFPTTNKSVKRSITKAAAGESDILTRRKSASSLLLQRATATFKNNKGADSQHIPVPSQIIFFGQIEAPRIVTPGRKSKKRPLDVRIFPKPPKFNKISCGDSHCLALSVKGTIYSWGNGCNGRLGNGSSLKRQECPIQLDCISDVDVAQISAGGKHSMCLSTQGDVYTWGCNSELQVGCTGQDETNRKDVLLPKKLDPLKLKASTIEAGSTVSSAICTTESYRDIKKKKSGNRVGNWKICSLS